MKKLIILAMVLALCFSGCAQFKTTLCNQNADEYAAISQQIADAMDSLYYFQSLVPTVPVQAIVAGLRLTIATLIEMRKGYCATPDQMQAVKATIDNARVVKAQIKAGKKLSL